jgi:two-component system cell cycle sensor histidine kinase/response regulator CckA
MATILVAEDRPVDRDLLVTLLGHHGHRVLEATNGEQALEVLRREPADLVISDVMMPTMDGYELVRQIRTDPVLATLPVLFYSATYLPHELEAMARACGVEVLTKPSEPQTILGAVDAALARRMPPSTLIGPEFHKAHLRLLTDKLVETQERLLLAVRSSNIGLWDWDVATNQYTTTPEAKSQLGFSEAEFDDSFSAWEQLVHPDDRARVLAECDACVAGRTPSYESEYRMRHRDGSYRWMLSRGVPHRDEAGRAVRMSGSRVDITGLKTAEAEANERARLSTVVADIAVAVTEGERLSDMLERCARAMVDRLDCVMARIWTVSPNEPVLELQVSEGLPIRPDETYRRIPIGQFAVGHVALDRQPRISNDVAGDPLVQGQEWMRQNQIVSFAGYPLVLPDRLVGVMALFGRHPLSETTLVSLGAVAKSIALGIERRQLEDSRRQLADILEATSDLVTIAPLEGPPVFINRAARAALGIGPSEHVPTLFEFRLPGFDEQFRRVILPAILRNGTWSGETEYVSRDGEVICVSQVSIAHSGAHGPARIISTISRDITEQKHASDALRSAEERTRFALEAARAGVFELDVATGRVVWSETMRVVQGFSSEEFGGTLESFVSLIHPDDRPAVVAAIREATVSPRDFQLEFRALWPDGTTHWVEAHGRVHLDAAGRPARVLGVAQDTTERRQLEEQLRQSQKLEAIGQLAGGLAHDFNNLLTVIVGYSRLLEEQFDEADPRRADLEEIERAGERAAGLTRQLLAFSRRQILQPVLIDLNDLIRETTRMLGRLIGEHIDLTLDLAPDLSSVKADPGQLEQILVNLAVNARDAMEQGGKLIITTEDVDFGTEFARSHAVEPGPYVRLSVSDTGTGMNEATKKRIFEPFFTTKEPGKGTGLGLATVFGIVKQSGGFIWVYSEVEHGTTFRIHLPRAAGLAAPSPVKAASGGVPRGTETVLVVEDQDAVRGFVRQVLTDAGYSVLVASNWNEALRLATDPLCKIDLLLTDVVMPELSGGDLATRIRAQYPALRVLYMSGFATDTLAHRGVLNPGTSLLQKPFAGADLARKVREVLDAPAEAD